MKLKAINAEDITVFSSLLQDALFTMMFMHHNAAEKQFHMLVNRFCWEINSEHTNKEYKKGDPVNYRSHCGLYISNAKSVKINRTIKHIDYSNILSLLVMKWTCNTNILTLTFSDGLELSVDCDDIAIYLNDMHEPWSTKSIPKHIFD